MSRIRRIGLAGVSLLAASAVAAPTAVAAPNCHAQLGQDHKSFNEFGPPGVTGELFSELAKQPPSNPLSSKPNAVAELNEFYRELGEACPRGQS